MPQTSSGERYRIWSERRQAWWRPDGWGYTTDIAEAGIFSGPLDLGPHSTSKAVPVEGAALAAAAGPSSGEG